MSTAHEPPTPDIPHAESSAAAIRRQSPLCIICQTKSAIYTCPRCKIQTCSLPCSTKHKTNGSGCSGLRNKAAYVPMNQYGYMALMSDYTFLEEMGRKVGDWGKEIAQGGYAAGNGASAGRGGIRGRGRGRGRDRGSGGVGFSSGKTTSKRDVLKMQLDFRDIEIEFLPNGMERRTLNQSSWDFKYVPLRARECVLTDRLHRVFGGIRNRTALLTVEWRFHPPRNLLAPPNEPHEPPFVFLTHRIALETSLLAAMRTHISERSKSKKDKGSIPSWVHTLVFPDKDVPDSFVTPLCVMGTPLDPLAALGSNPHVPQPGRLLRSGYYKLDASQSFGIVLKHKHFVEFPTIDVWEEDAFEGIIVDDRGAVVHDDHDKRRPKRRKLNPKDARKAINGMLGGYGSDSEEREEQNMTSLLGAYAESEEDSDTGHGGVAPPDNEDDWGGDEDAEGETDEEYEGNGNPEELAAMLQKLREAGALRDPGKDSASTAYEDPNEEQVDWGDSGDEEYGG